MLNKLKLINKTFTKITGNARRSEIQLFNERAVREAFLNAVIHNDYSELDMPSVHVFDDRITIESNGGLPSGIDHNGFFNGVSKPRNRWLVKVFSDLNLVEQLGSGVKRITNEYGKDVFEILSNRIRVNIPFNTKKQIKNNLEQKNDDEPVMLFLKEVIDKFRRDNNIELDSKLKKSQRIELLKIIKNENKYFKLTQRVLSDAIGVTEKTVREDLREV